jgi:hypothetical protein
LAEKVQDRHNPWKAAEESLAEKAVDTRKPWKETGAYLVARAADRRKPWKEAVAVVELLKQVLHPSRSLRR